MKNNETTQKIVHIVHVDKFTKGYIDFMNSYMNEFEHIFIIYDNTKIETSVLDIDELKNNTNVIIHEDKYKYVLRKDIKAVLKNAYRIIVSGLFFDTIGIWRLPRGVLRKTYVHYWGGDFYFLRNKTKLNNIRGVITRAETLRIMRITAGAVFLIEGEYDEFKKITGIAKKKVFVAKMPTIYEDTHYLVAKYKQYIKSSDSLCVIVGNSATATNHHIDILGLLSIFKDENMRIYCPLNYGKSDYRRSVIEYGKSVFGEKFIPLTEWIEESEYYKLLAGMDIGIFGCDRQQAMGNINTLLAYGKKVYLRSDVSMWKNYNKKGFIVYDIEDLKNESFETFCNSSRAKENKKVAESIDGLKEAIDQWNDVFRS